MQLHISMHKIGWCRSKNLFVKHIFFMQKVGKSKKKRKIKHTTHWFIDSYIVCTVLCICICTSFNVCVLFKRKFLFVNVLVFLTFCLCMCFLSYQRKICTNICLLLHLLRQKKEKKIQSFLSLLSRIRVKNCVLIV